MINQHNVYKKFFSLKISCVEAYQANCSMLLLCYSTGGFATITESWVKDKSPENCLSSVEVYDPETNSWQAGPDLPQAVCAMGVVKYYGTIYIIGRFCLNFLVSLYHARGEVLRHHITNKS